MDGLQDAIQLGQIHGPNASEFDSDRSAVSSKINQPFAMTLGALGFIASPAIEIEIRREWLSLPIGDFKIWFGHKSSDCKSRNHDQHLCGDIG
jgi:hypothetical protein